MAAAREVRVVEVAPRRTAVIAVVTSWEEFPGLWPSLLGEVWEAVRAEGLEAGRNVMLYLDDVARGGFASTGVIALQASREDRWVRRGRCGLFRAVRRRGERRVS